MSNAQNSPEKVWLFHPDFPAHWKRESLYSMARWVNGLAFRDIQFSATGKPIVKISEIKGGITEQTKFTEQSFDDSIRVRTGDMLFSWSGQPETSIDVSWWRGPEGWLNQHVFRVTPSPDIEPTFFYYLLRYLKPNFVGIARNKQTTGLGHVTRRDLQNLEAAYPNISEQRAIAQILGTLDDKIELNRRMSETLEAMARALFRSWFVDLHPVRAKAEGRDPGLPKRIADLFPASVVDSELGEIPDGWEVTPLADVLRESQQRAGETAVPEYSSTNTGLRPRAERFSKKLSASSAKNKLVREGFLVFGLSRRVLNFGVMNDSIGSVSSAYKVFEVVDSNRLIPDFLERLIRERMEYFYNAVSASSREGQSVSPDGLRHLRIVLPPVHVLRAFYGQTRPIAERIVACGTEVRTLASLRDYLLPKLISGEIRVTSAKAPRYDHDI